jgi:hypothetical protein
LPDSDVTKNVLVSTPKKVKSEKYQETK